MTNINPYNYIQPGFEGALYTSSNSVINNAIVVGEDEIPFGRMVALGTDAGPGGMPLVSPIAGSSDSFYGISVATNAHEIPDDPNQVQSRGYDPKESIPVMRQGVIYVTPETDVSPDDPVFVRFAGAGTSPGDLEAVGRFTTVDDAETVAVNGCRWLTHSPAGRATGLEVGVTIF